VQQKLAPALCSHHWTIVNHRGGFLVVEGCFHCRSRISFFSEEPVPPVDDYREGDHFWSHLGNFQASKFDLRCEKCGAEVKLRDVTALMLCMKCNPDCGVYKAGAGSENRKAWVYTALCANTSHATGACVSAEGIEALNEYFNQGLHDPSKKILIVPCRLRPDVDTCEGVVLADVGLTDFY
jgi:hypothetical protein